MSKRQTTLRSIMSVSQREIGLDDADNPRPDGDVLGSERDHAGVGNRAVCAKPSDRTVLRSSRRVPDASARPDASGESASETAGKGLRDGSMDSRKNESEFYREILRRAQRFRERAAESLRQSHVSRKEQAHARTQTDVARRRRRFLRQG